MVIREDKGAEITPIKRGIGVIIRRITIGINVQVVNNKCTKTNKETRIIREDNNKADQTNSNNNNSSPNNSNQECNNRNQECNRRNSNNR